MKMKLVSVLIAVGLCGVALAADSERASDYVVVIFLNAQDAKPGDEIQVSAEIYGREGVEVLVPDPRNVDLTYDHVSRCGDSRIYCTLLDYQPPQPTRTLAAGEKLSAHFVFTVPSVCGVLSIRALGVNSIPAALRVHGDRSVSVSHTKPTLAEGAEAIRVLPEAFRRVE